MNAYNITNGDYIESEKIVVAESFISAIKKYEEENPSKTIKSIELIAENVIVAKTIEKQQNEGGKQ